MDHFVQSFFIEFSYVYKVSFVKIAKSGLSFFLFSFSFLFSFQFIFYFSIFRNLGLGLEVIGHTVTSDGMITTLIIRLERRK